MAKIQKSVFLEEELWAEIDAEAEKLERSRNWVIGMRLKNSRSLPPLFSVDRGTGVVTVVPEGGDVVMASRKKIADILGGGGAQSSGGTPDLPAVGKAQDGVSVGDLQGKIKSLREMPGFKEPDQAVIYGRSYSGAAPPGLPEEEKRRWEENALATINRRVAEQIPPFSLSEQDEEFAEENPEFAAAIVPPNSFVWSAEELKNIADEVQGGFSTLSPETLVVVKERAAVDAEMAKILHLAGVELDREILVRWGLSENYKPKMEDVNGGKKSVEKSVAGKEGAATGKNRRPSKVVPKNDDGGEGAAVGVGKPKVDMQALRDICAGNIPDGAVEKLEEPHEVDLCGFKSYNEIDGENYVCGKEVHGPKVKHGEWLKI